MRLVRLANRQMVYILHQELQAQMVPGKRRPMRCTHLQDQQTQMEMEIQAQQDYIHLHELLTIMGREGVLFLNLEQFSLVVLDQVMVHQAIRHSTTTSDLVLDQVEQELAIQVSDYILHQEPLLLLVNHRNLRLKFVLHQEADLHQETAQPVETQQGCTLHREVLLLLQLEDLLQSVFMYLLEVQPQKEMVLLAMELPDYTHRQGRLALKVADLQIQANFARFLFLLLLLQVDPARQADSMSCQELLPPMDLLAKLRTGCTRCRGHQATPQMVHQVHRRFERFQEVEQIKRTENLLPIV
jgi:hypothetical protein